MWMQMGFHFQIEAVNPQIPCLISIGRGMIEELCESRGLHELEEVRWTGHSR